MELTLQKFRRLDSDKGELNWPVDGTFTTLMKSSSLPPLKTAVGPSKKGVTPEVLKASNDLRNMSNNELTRWISEASCQIDLPEVDAKVDQLSRELRAKAREYDQLTALRQERANSINEDMTESEAKVLIDKLREVIYRHRGQTARLDD